MSRTKEFGFRVIVQTFMEHKEGDKYSSIKKIEMSLEPSPNLNADSYLKEQGKGGPTKQGSEAITSILIQALVANIHQSHQNEEIDSAAHLRKIISLLEDGFIAQSETIKGTRFTNLNSIRD